MALRLGGAQASVLQTVAILKTSKPVSTVWLLGPPMIT